MVWAGEDLEAGLEVFLEGFELVQGILHHVLQVLNFEIRLDSFKLKF